VNLHREYQARAALRGHACWYFGSARKLLFSPLSLAALAQPTDEPFDEEYGKQESDDNAYADKHIRQNDHGALDGHGDRQSRKWASSVHHLLNARR
jgi:hypothetical protein